MRTALPCLPCFDRLLIEALGPDRVTVAVRGGPVINDATRDDAREAGLEGEVELIDNGKMRCHGHPFRFGGGNAGPGLLVPPQERTGRPADHRPRIGGTMPLAAGAASRRTAESNR